MENCRGWIRYKRLTLKRNHITPYSNRLIDPYYSILDNPQKTKCVHNGWIMDHNPMIDFAEEKDFPYLRR